MIKKLLVAALVGCAFSAHAADERSWRFEWTGLFDSSIFNSVSERSFSGYFSAIDINGDDVIATNELTYFDMHFDTFLPCGEDKCEIKSFSYSGGNNLLFDASTQDFSWGSPDRSASLTTSSWNISDGRHSSTYCKFTGGCSYDAEIAMPGVRMVVTEILPVPEPQGYAMFLMGLAGISYFLRGRGRK